MLVHGDMNYQLIVFFSVNKEKYRKEGRKCFV